MKVLFQGRLGLFDAYGGDRIQVEKTAEQLRRLGVDVDVSTELSPKLEKYDLVHIFQMDWTSETHLMAKNAKSQNKPLVLSPIHHKVSEVKRFDDNYVFDFRRISKILFNEQHKRDTFKNVYRCVTNPKLIKPTFYAITHGLKKMHQETLKLSDVVLVQTELEAKDLIETYNQDFLWKKVQNGVGENFLNTKDLENPLNIENYIFSVGRIEPRKNQLKIIEAVKELREQIDYDLKLVLVGRKNPKNHFEYTRLFEKALLNNDWIIYVESVPYGKIPAYFKYAKVCVSASWFETTGLTLLEALFCGTNAVASSPRAEEILGSLASYCDPGDPKSIVAAIKKELLAPRPVLPQTLREEFTWENAAKKTLSIYNELLEIKK